MNRDIIVAGVGGQGVLSLSGVIAAASLQQGLHVRQSEVHGMAQRGGAVLASLRLSDAPIRSHLVARGTAHLIIGLEPVESLRYLECLSEGGAVVSATDPVVNIPDYPDQACVLDAIRSLPRAWLVEAATLAKRAGSALAANMVMVGAAAPLLPLRCESIESLIRDLFSSKGDRVVDINLAAFRSGREAVRCVPV